jgi:hypothetical protein
LDCLPLRIREIGPSARRFSYQYVEDSLFWRDHRRKWRELGAWGPTLSGVRRWTASHCVFAKLGPRLGDITTTPRRFRLLTRSPRRVMCVRYVGTKTERDVAVDCLALRIREIGPSTRPISCQRVEDSLFWRARRRKWRVFWRIGTQAERDAALDCLALRIREIGPSTRRYHDDASKLPYFDTLALESDVRLVRGDPSRAGCGGGLPRVVYSRKCALDAAIFAPARRILPVLERSPSKTVRSWRVGTQAERGAAVDCLALRIREIGPSTRQYHDDASKFPSFDTLALESDVRLIRGDRELISSSCCIRSP